MAIQKKNAAPAFVTTLAVLVLSACASNSNAPQESQQQALQGEVVEHNALKYGEQPFFKWLQNRIDTLAPKVLPEQKYNHNKAQCWLHSAQGRYIANNNTNYSYVEGALTESARIVGLLEKEGKKSLPIYDTPLVTGSLKVREDLWKRASDLRTQPQFSCGADMASCAEVALVHAGHAQQRQEDADFNTAIASAEKMLGDAEQAIKACAPTPTPTPVAAAPVTPAPTPEPTPAAQSEQYVLPGDALFRFGKGGLSGMLPEGRESLQTLLNTVRSYQSVESITITGHTDKFNTVAFNQALSERRAGTVRDWLVKQGFDAGIIHVVGAGKLQPLVTGCGNTRTRKTIACLQPNRRVEVIIRGIKQ